MTKFTNKTLNLPQINTSNEVIQPNILIPSHSSYLTKLEQEYLREDRFFMPIFVNEDYESINAVFHIEVLKNLDIDIIEVVVVPTDKINNELFGISTRLNILELSAMEKNKLFTVQTKLLVELGKKSSDAKKDVALDNNISVKMVQQSNKNMENLNKDLQETINKFLPNIGHREINNTAKLSDEQQLEINDKLLEMASNNESIDIKSYKKILKSYYQSTTNKTKKQNIFNDSMRLLFKSIENMKIAETKNDTKLLKKQFESIQDKYLKLFPSNTTTNLTFTNNTTTKAA